MPLPVLFPCRLALGDLIGVAAPASPPDEPQKIDEALARLVAAGFRVKEGRHLRERDSYLAGTDAERAADLQAMFADPEVRGIFALRGGYGSCRILPLLDYAAIRANPKPFIGYSDITALHGAILTHSGLVTFHGPNALEAFLPGNVEAFERTLLGGLRAPGDGPSTDLPASILFSRTEESAAIKTVTPGRVTGRLIGGNMTCLLRLLATPYAPDFRGAILFLEDTGERAYRIDGMFTHLRLAGVLEQIGGLVLGRFSHCEVTERWRIEGFLQREAERVGVPCVSGAPIGHFPEQILVPHGAMAELDAGEGRLVFFEGR